MLAFLYAISPTPISWSNPAAGSGTTTATVNPTFSTPTGGNGSFTYSASLTKPVGSGASLANANTLSPSFTTDIDGVYIVRMTATDSLGQVSYSTYVYVYDSGVATSWQEIATYDLTGATPQLSMNTEGVNYTLTLASGQTITMRNSHSTGTAGTPVKNHTTNGLEMQITGNVSAPNNTTTSLLLPVITPMKNLTMVELLVTVNSLPTNSDGFTIELGETEPITSNDPGLYYKYNRVSGTSYTHMCGRRATTTATDSTGVSAGTSVLANVHIQLIFIGRLCLVYVDNATSFALPFAPTTYQGNVGSPAVVPADTIISPWSNNMLQLTLTEYANLATSKITLASYRVMQKVPVS